MEIQNVNSFLIDSELKSGKGFPYAFYFTNATESEFKDLLNGYISENESQDGPNFSVQRFSNYVVKNGFYIKTKGNFIIPPYAPVK